MISDLTHFDERGNSRMVDVGAKEISSRRAIASGLVRMKSETLTRIKDKSMEKGDVLAIAALAGIMATKKTSDLIPLCHPLRLDSANVEFSFPNQNTIRIEASVAAHERTGVEMEALTAVSVAGLTIYDMCKSIDREMEIAAICLEQKSGGKHGPFNRQQQNP